MKLVCMAQYSYYCIDRANICLTCSLPAIDTRGGAVYAILGRGYLGSDARSPSIATRNSGASGFHFCVVHSTYQTTPPRFFSPTP
jgi:hypothetical protein